MNNRNENPDNFFNFDTPPANNMQNTTETRSVCSNVEDIGTATAYVAMIALFGLAVAGSLTADILILISLSSNNNNNNNNNHNNENAFLTGYLIGNMNRNNHRDTHYLAFAEGFGDLGLLQQSLVMFLATAPGISIAAGIAHYYEHPNITNGFLAAWGACSGLLILGLLIHSVGHRFAQTPTQTTPSTLDLSSRNRHGLFVDVQTQTQAPVVTVAVLVSSPYVPEAPVIRIQDNDKSLAMVV